MTYPNLTARLRDIENRNGDVHDIQLLLSLCRTQMEALESIAAKDRPELTDTNYWSVKQIADLVEIVITDTGTARTCLTKIEGMCK